MKQKESEKKFSGLLLARFPTDSLLEIPTVGLSIFRATLMRAASFVPHKSDLNAMVKWNCFFPRFIAVRGNFLTHDDDETMTDIN